MATNPGATARRLKARQDAQRLAPVIKEIKETTGASVSLLSLARALAARSVRPPRGGRWSATTVSRVLARIAELENI